MIKNKIFSVILYYFYTLFVFFLSSVPLLTMEKVESDFSETYIIKNDKYSEFIFSGDKVSMTAVKSSPSISKQSVVIIEKKSQGYLIKNKQYGEYLCIDDKEICNCTKVARWSKSISSNSYFNIFKENDRFVIKNDKYSDYLCIKGLFSYIGLYWVGDTNIDNKYLLTSKYITESSYFIITPFIWNF